MAKMTWTHTSVVLMDKRCMSNIKDIIIENHSHAIVYKYFEIKLANLHNGSSELFVSSLVQIIVLLLSHLKLLVIGFQGLYCYFFVVCLYIRLCYTTTLVPMIHTNVNILRWLLSCKERLRQSSLYVNSKKGMFEQGYGCSCIYYLS